MYAFEVLALGLVASLIGCVWLATSDNRFWCSYYATRSVGSCRLRRLAPIAYGVGIGIVTLAGFALPPLLHLKNVPSGTSAASRFGQPADGKALAPTLAALVGDRRAYLLACGRPAARGLCAWRVPARRLGVLAGGAWLLVRSLSGLRTRVGVAWRFGLTNLTRRSGGTAVQVVAFGLGITALLLLGLVRTDILDEWQRSLTARHTQLFSSEHSTR